MLPWDPTGKIGPKKPLPDHVSIVDPKDEAPPAAPYSEQKGAKPQDAQQPQPPPIMMWFHLKKEKKDLYSPKRNLIRLFFLRYTWNKAWK